ncbi:MAG: DUF4252 domain-containing protein [Flavobacteriaceae bacterium]|nr:DUF4252 domain-containing protein [Flavobacteriaceae bacterium]
MKKAIFILITILIPMVSFSQNAFDKFEDDENVTSLIVNNRMFRLLTSMNLNTDDKESQQFLDLIKGIDNLKVFMSEDKSTRARMEATLASYLKSNKSLEQLMRFKEDGKIIKFYIKEGKDADHVKELLMHATGIKMGNFTHDETHDKRQEQTVIFSITGDFDLKKISKLTSDLNIPGSKHLKKINKEN